MSEKPEYDSNLGGQQVLPRSLHIGTFTSTRVKEIKAMDQAIQGSSGTKLVFQKLPKHMRRRAMSYDIKRVPRSVRQKHASQMKKAGLPPISKRPIRKYRRRPKNLLKSYMSRKQKIFWLETHIWHAKRFHMVNKWGYRLPDSPCDKAFRACYRATTQHCLIQDISYYECFELSGAPSKLIDGLKKMYEPSFGLTVVAKAFLKGTREGTAVLLNVSTRKPIGNVHFIWKPQTTDESSLQMWVHPAYASELASNFVECFNLQEVPDDITNVTILKNNEENILLLRRLDLNRFRITGPLANSVLHKVLIPIDFSKCQDAWLGDFTEKSHHLDSVNKSSDYWKGIENSSLSYVGPHVILSLIVNDPRVNFPKTRTKASITEVRNDVNVDLFDYYPCSPLWSTKYCKEIEDCNVSNQKLLEIRAKTLVSEVETDYIHTAIPVVIIQRPGNKTHNLGYGSGWDLIVPPGWGQAFWLALTMWGGRAGGLRETESIRFESGGTPLLMPDTTAGEIEENETAETYERKYFTLPPNKRPNYNKFGIVEPFSFKWKSILQQWQSDKTVPVETFSVLRDVTILSKLQQVFSKLHKEDEINFSENVLVPVRLKLEKGLAKKFAVIALPNQEDLNTNTAPIEPLRPDKNQKLRKELRTQLRDTIKRLKRRKKRAKLTQKTVQNDEEFFKNTSAKIRRLWLPKTTDDCRTNCCREIMGSVTNGSFSFVQGFSTAVGFVALQSLKSLQLLKRRVVLVRNTISRKYYFADLEVIL